MSLLKGKNVVIVVMAPSYTSLHKRLTAQGGHNRNVVNSKTDYVVSNGYSCQQLSHAKKLGTTIITEAEFEGLLAGKPLSGEGAPGESSNALGDAFGRVRSIMASSSALSAIWFELIEVLDACEPEGREALVAYIESMVERESRHSTFDGYFGHMSDPMPESRVWGSVPRAWMESMSQKVRDPKYNMVRELDFIYSGMSATFLNSLLTHPDLTRLSRVRLAHGKKPSKAMMKTLCHHLRTAHLEHLGLGRINLSVAMWLGEYATQARALRTLDLSALSFTRGGYGSTASERFVFITAPLFSTIEMLVLPPMQGYKGSSWLCDRLTEASRFPALRALFFRQRHPHLIRHLAEDILPHTGVQRRIKHIDIGPAWWSDSSIGEQLQALSDVAYTGQLDRLVWSDQAGSAHDERSREEVGALLCEHLPGSSLLDGTRELELGAWLTPELRERLERAHPELVLV